MLTLSQFTSLASSALSVPQGGVVPSNLYVDRLGRIRCQPKAQLLDRLWLGLASSKRKLQKLLQRLSGSSTNAIHPERHVNPFVVKSEE